MHPALARLVGAVPHQPDRLAHRLGDLGRLDGVVAEQLVPERAAAGDHVDRHLVLGQAESPWRCPPGRRSATFSPAQTVALVGAHVGDGGVRLERGAAAEHEGELGLDRLGEHRDLGHGERQLGLAQPRRGSVVVGLALDGARVPVDVERPDRVDALAEGLRRARRRRSSISATSVTPGIARTAASLRSCFGVPLSVGGRHTIVGSASGTSRSIANFFCPVTMSRASTRFAGVPMTVKESRSLSSTSTFFVVGLAAFAASSPYVAERPSGAVMTPSLDFSSGHGGAELDGGGVEQRALGDRGRDPDRGVRRDGGVGAAGELVEHQLGTGRRQGDVHLLDGQVELLGDDHRGRGGDALADLHPRQRERRRCRPR